MLKRIVVVLGIQSVILLILGVAIGFIGLFAGPTIGGVLAASEASFAYNAVSPFVCPEGTSLVAEEGASFETDSFDSAGGTSMTPTEVSCVGEAQVIPNMEIQAFAAISALAFALCFFPLFIPLGLISLLIVWRATKGMTAKPNAAD